MADNDEFNFFLKFCTSLIFNLPDVRDRMLAAQWLQKLRDLHADDPQNTLCTEYLKLLLFAMQKDRLTGIFYNPPSDGPLETFSGMCMAIDMADLVKSSETQLPAPPSIHMSFSGDLCEFVAVQEIPNFGLHGYYAISTDPLPTWIQPRVDLVKTGKYKSDNDNQQRGLKPFPVKPNNETESECIKVPLTEDLTKCAIRNKNSIVEKIAQQRIHTTTQNKETPNIQTRPCWGRNPYVGSLLDQSPHIATDLDAPQIDAFLHAFKGREMKVADAKDKDSCSLYPQRKKVEKMMDTPCTLIPDLREDLKCQNVEENDYHQFHYPIGSDTMGETDMLETSSAHLDWRDKCDNEEITYGHNYSRMGTSHPGGYNEDNQLEMDNYKRRIRPGARAAKPKQKPELPQQFRDISKIEASSSDKPKRPSKSLRKESLNESWKPLAHSSFLN